MSWHSTGTKVKGRKKKMKEEKEKFRKQPILGGGEHGERTISQRGLRCC